jgi:hypothetical protein
VKPKQPLGYAVIALILFFVIKDPDGRCAHYQQHRQLPFFCGARFLRIPELSMSRLTANVQAAL